MGLGQFVGSAILRKSVAAVDFDRGGTFASGRAALLWHFPVPIGNLVGELPTPPSPGVCLTGNESAGLVDPAAEPPTFIKRFIPLPSQ